MYQEKSLDNGIASKLDRPIDKAKVLKIKIFSDSWN